jgi:hypothetical protein
MASTNIINFTEHRNNTARRELHLRKERRPHLMSAELVNAIQQLIQQLRKNKPSRPSD